jgi:hypothetical protein
MTTTHGLSFEVSDHFQSYGLDDGYAWQNFRIGTVEGLWSNKNGAYRILAIENKEPHNGHLTDFFEWFQHAAKRDKLPLIVHEVMNMTMARILLKRGFVPVVETSNFQWTP